MTLRELFDAADDEFLEFGRIPEADRRHPRPDLCAFLYLHEKLGGKKNALGEYDDMVAAAEHDEIWLCYGAEDCGALTAEDVVYLSRCGVRLDENGLRLFV